MPANPHTNKAVDAGLDNTSKIMKEYIQFFLGLGLALALAVAWILFWVILFP